MPRFCVVRMTFGINPHRELYGVETIGQIDVYAMEQDACDAWTISR